MVENMTEDQIMDLQEAFSMFDEDGSGSIDAEELGKVLSNLGQKMSEDELADMIAEVDHSGDGSIDFPEFLEMMAMRMKNKEETIEELRTLFKTFDKTKERRGFITAIELRRVMLSIGEKVTEDEVDELIKEVDSNGDGCFDYEEFIRRMFE